MDHSIFSGMQILLNHQWVKNQAVIVDKEKIKAIIPIEMVAHHLPAKRYEFPENHLLIPGLIDCHIHGVANKDVMDGTEEAFIKISRALAIEGVTGFLATTMTADHDRIEKVLKLIPQAIKNQEGAAMLGVHLEGPFISKAKMGAQHGVYAEQPDFQLIEQWQEMTEGAIKIVTLAPELSEALPFIQRICHRGIKVSIGHTNATYKETCVAIKAGCTQATHLFNAMRGIHQREPGAVSALLLSDDITAELIADGIHLHPAVIELAYRLKGKEKIMLVTDAMRAKCLGDGQYDLCGQEVSVHGGKATLPDGTLAGSTLHMPQAIKNMMQFSQCSLIDAINMASLNPARVLQLENNKGSIAVGKDADLVVFNPDLEVMLTMRCGREIFRK